MNKRMRLLMVAGMVVLGIVLVVAGTLTVQRLRLHLSAKQYRQRMSDPVYLQEQTTRLQPIVEQQIRRRFPQAQITALPSVEQKGILTYEIRLPVGESRALPQLHAQIARMYGEYCRQGYRAKFLIYQNGKVIQSIP